MRSGTFFATDGIGGTVKRLVTRASLQAPTANQILTAEAMQSWAHSNIANITFFYVTGDQVKAHTKDLKLEERIRRCENCQGNAIASCMFAWKNCGNFAHV